MGAKTGFASKKQPNVDIRDRQVALEDQFSSADHARQVIARFEFIISNKYIEFLPKWAIYVSLDIQLPKLEHK